MTNKLELDYSTIKSLSKLVNKENLAEIEVGNGENYVRIIRKLPENVVASSSPASSVQAVQPALKHQFRKKPKRLFLFHTKIMLMR